VKLAFRQRAATVPPSSTDESGEQARFISSRRARDSAQERAPIARCRAVVKNWKMFSPTTVSTELVRVGLRYPRG